MLALLPDNWQKAQLEDLLEIPEGQRITVYGLKTGAGDGATKAA